MLIGYFSGSTNPLRMPGMTMTPSLSTTRRSSLVQITLLGTIKSVSDEYTAEKNPLLNGNEVLPSQQTYNASGARKFLAIYTRMKSRSTPIIG